MNMGQGNFLLQHLFLPFSLLSALKEDRKRRGSDLYYTNSELICEYSESGNTTWSLLLGYPLLSSAKGTDLARDGSLHALWEANHLSNLSIYYYSFGHSQVAFPPRGTSALADIKCTARLAWLTLTFPGENVSETVCKEIIFNEWGFAFLAALNI